MPRLLRLLVPLILLAAPAAAPALPVELPQAAQKPAQLLDRTVTVRGHTSAACHRAVLAGRPGVTTRTVSAPAVGEVSARLDAAGGDWDLALFDAKGREMGGGAQPGAREIASGYARGAAPVTLQACRRTGDASRARLRVDFTEIPVDPTPEMTQLVDVSTPTEFDKQRLSELGFDLTEHGGVDSLGVVLHGDADAARLRAAGFTWTVRVRDLVAQDLRNRRRELRSSRRAPVPSGRTTYRTLAEYETELKDLAAKNPGLVRLIELPHKTLLGRTVLGIEIAQNVNLNDGRPAFFNMGVHHAREWPAGEHPMEWAYELLNSYKALDPRATRIVRESRNIIVPIVNPDGFNASRTAGLAFPEGRPEDPFSDTEYAVSGTATGGEYRRKNCRLPDADTANCTTSPGIAENGVDPNRNYGGLWGGPGAEDDPIGMTYRGPGPFSEAETSNIQWLVSQRHVMTLITNHTTAGLVLRAPGLASLGDPVDEHRGYKALGDAMALQNGYFSQKSFELYDTTGTTEDWSYNATGGYGFTFEIYCGEPNYKTGDCDDPAFHPLYETQAKEWDGSSPQSNHENDPGNSAENPFGMQPKYDGKGNREAYYIAAETALDERQHSVITGEGVPGATLRLTKKFKTETSPQEKEDPEQQPEPILFDDKLETVYEVGASGRFRWHVNPSTRPIVAKDRGVPNAGPAAPAETRTGSVAGASDDPAGPPDNVAIPCGDAATTDPTCFNVHPVDVPATGENYGATIRVTWNAPTSDWDVRVYEDTNKNGDLDEDDKQVGSSETGPGSDETTSIPSTSKLAAGTRFFVRVTNFYGGEEYDLLIRWNRAAPFRPATTEAWTLTCELGGRVLDTQQVQIDRGQVRNVNLGACQRALAPPPPPPPPRPPLPPDACTAGSGFRSVGVSPRGRGLRFRFSRRIDRPVTVSVFQQSIGRRITGERLVARFTGRRRAFNWNGRANRRGRTVRNGYLFARFTMRTPAGNDVRRVTLRRSSGRFRQRPAFYRRATCDALPSFKIERPVFGGATNRALNVSFRLAEPARVRIDVFRGSTRVRSLGPANRRAAVTHRVRIDPKRLRRGEYRVRITVLGARPLTASLTARRL